MLCKRLTRAEFEALPPGTQGYPPNPDGSPPAVCGCPTCETALPTSYFRQESLGRGLAVPPIPEGCSCTATQCDRTTARNVGKPSFTTYGVSTDNLLWRPSYPAALDASGNDWNIVAEVQYYDQYQDTFGGQPLSSLCDGKWKQCKKYKVRFRVLVCENQTLVDVTETVLQDTPLTINYTGPSFQQKTFTSSTPHYNYEYCRMVSGGLSASNPAGNTGAVWITEDGCTECSTGQFLPFP